MAKTKENTADNADTKTKEARDYASEIEGHFNLAKAEEMFGKENATKAYQAVANAGGYGSLNSVEAQTTTLAVPGWNKTQSDTINQALAEFEQPSE